MSFENGNCMYRWSFKIRTHESFSKRVCERCFVTKTISLKVLICCLHLIENMFISYFYWKDNAVVLSLAGLDGGRAFLPALLLFEGRWTFTRIPDLDQTEKNYSEVLIQPTFISLEPFGVRPYLYGLGYPRQPSPRVTLGELTFH